MAILFFFVVLISYLPLHCICTLCVKVDYWPSARTLVWIINTNGPLRLFLAWFISNIMKCHHHRKGENIKVVSWNKTCQNTKTRKISQNFTKSHCFQRYDTMKVVAARVQVLQIISQSWILLACKWCQLVLSKKHINSKVGRM